MAKSEGSGAAVVVVAVMMALPATGGSVTVLAARLWETRKLEVKVRPRALPEVAVAGDSDGKVKGVLGLGAHEWSCSPDGRVEKEISGGFLGLAGGFGDGGQSLGVEIPLVFRYFEVILGFKGQVGGREDSPTSRRSFLADDPHRASSLLGEAVDGL